MNQLGFPVLTLLLALPLVGAATCLFLGASGARWTALLTTFACLGLGLLLWANY